MEIYIERRARRKKGKEILCKPGAYFRFCVASKIDFSPAAEHRKKHSSESGMKEKDEELGWGGKGNWK